jgi:hypothetical protein
MRSTWSSSRCSRASLRCACVCVWQQQHTQAARLSAHAQHTSNLQAADEDGSGELDIDEFCSQLGPHLGFNLRPQQVAQLFMKIDADAGGTVDWCVCAWVGVYMRVGVCVCVCVCACVCVQLRLQRRAQGVCAISQTCTKPCCVSATPVPHPGQPERVLSSTCLTSNVVGCACCAWCALRATASALAGMS